MKKVYALVFVTAFLFSTMEVACKIGGNSLDPFQLTFLRFVVGGLFLLPFAIVEIKKNNISLTAKDFLILTGVGTLGIPISMMLFQLSIMMSNASTISVLICSSPFFSMMFAHLFTKEKIDREKALALLIALLAIAFMLRPWDIQEGNTAKGLVFIVLAAMGFGGYTIAGKVSAQKMGLIAQTSFSFLLGSAVLLLVMLVIGRPVMENVVDNLPVILYIGIFVTGTGYYTYFKSIELSDVATGSFAFFLKPVFAPILALILLHEKILWNTVVGIVLILIASLINITHQKRLLHQKKIETL